MININKTSVYVLMFFIVLFSVFIYLKPEITGMVTANALTPNQTSGYFNNTLLGGSIIITFSEGDAIPYDTKFKLMIMNTTPTGDSAGVKSSIEIPLTTILTTNSNVAPPINDSLIIPPGLAGITSDKNINSPPNEAPWEGIAIKTYNFSGTSNQVSIFLKDFNLNTPNIAQVSNSITYDLILNSTWDCPALTKLADGTTDAGCPKLYNISTYRTTIIVRNNNLSLIYPPTLQNITGGNRFRINDYINCTATIIDANNDIPTNISARFWGPSKNQTSPSKIVTWISSDYTKCSSSEWNTGKVCSISTQIISSDIIKDIDLGFWNCSISVYDGYGINISINSSNIITMNNTPVTFVGVFSNLSWFNDTDESDAITLESSSNGFYDPDSTLNFTVFGNSSINVTIISGHVNLVGKYRNTTGIFQIFFNATENLTKDNFSSAKSNNITINISRRPSSSCTQSWSCTSWSTCTSNSQLRTCIDSNSCGNETNKPNITQSCVSTPSTPSPPSIPTSGSGTSTGSSGVNQSQKAGTTSETETFTTKTIILTVAIIFGLVSLAGAGYFLIQYLNSREKSPIINIPTEPPREIKRETVDLIRTIEEKPVSIANTPELRTYINNAMKNRTPLSKIKQDLISAGWKEKQVSEEINFTSLKSFIKVKFDQGMRREELISLLKMKGWSESQIEDALKEVSPKQMI